MILHASCPGNSAKLPQIDYVGVMFLSKNSMSRVQTLDLGIILCVRRQYRRRQTKRAIDLSSWE